MYGLNVNMNVLNKIYNLLYNIVQILNTQNVNHLQTNKFFCNQVQSVQSLSIHFEYHTIKAIPPDKNLLKYGSTSR